MFQLFTSKTMNPNAQPSTRFTLLFRLTWRVAFLLLASCPSLTVSAATVWVGNVKVVAVHTEVAGNLYIEIDQPLSSGACAPSTIIALPKVITAVNLTVPDTVLSRIQAIAQSAKAQNAVVYFGLESSWGCQWGQYPILVQMSERK
jgi:hypothetical protein